MVVRHSRPTNVSLMPTKARSCLGVQGGNALSADLVIRSASAVKCSASLGRKADTYLTRPRKERVCVAFLGRGHERILSTFLLSGSMPLADMWWPRKSTSVHNSFVLFGLMYKFAFQSALKTSRV